MSLGMWITIGLLVLWLLTQLKTSRPDGDFVQTHPFRRIMFFIMTKRNESIVYFDGSAEVDKHGPSEDSARWLRV